MSITETLLEYTDYSDREVSECTEDGPRMYLLINRSLNLSPGKVCAQVGHGVEEITTKMLQSRKRRKRWKAYTSSGSTKIALKVNSEAEIVSILEETKNLMKAYVIDAGRTQCPSGSLTVVAYIPLYAHEVPSSIKRLKLY
jgi:peptidyl-tRNA hydrolase